MLVLLLVGGLALLIRRSAQVANRAMGFGSSKPRLQEEGAVAVRFEDVAGIAEAKEELQEELLAIWREHKPTVLMITHDIDEALFLSDRIVMMTNGPSATIGEIMEVPFERPRHYETIQDDPRYGQLRNHALDFLYRRYAHDDD